MAASAANRGESRPQRWMAIGRVAHKVELGLAQGRWRQEAGVEALIEEFHQRAGHAIGNRPQAA